MASNEQEEQLGPDDSCIVFKGSGVCVTLKSQAESGEGELTAHIVECLGRAVGDPEFMSYLFETYSEDAQVGVDTVH